MVQSLGISVGNANSYVAGGQGGGIEIFLNEYSNRSTPSMVAFTDHFRSIGVDASNNLMMNMKNTIYDIMVLLGRPYKELIADEKIQSLDYPFKLEEASDGQALVVVRHLGEERKFTVTQVLAMLFTKLKEISCGATNCVLSCPQFFNDNQKAALAQAAVIAGLTPLQIISDMTAVVLSYAYCRTKKEDPPKTIAFVNMGQSNLQAVVALLTPGEDKVQILSAESDTIGGRDFDHLLAKHFVANSNLSLNQKSYLKLVLACEKLKKQLSANANEIPLHVESLISEDNDYTSKVDRATFEQLAQPIFQRIEACLRKALDNAKAACETFELQIVEIVGGSTRIPAIKQIIQQVFEITPSTTLNTDEAVARGCVLHCATLHPGMKVKCEIKMIGSENYKPPTLARDETLHRIETELMDKDTQYKLRLEVRNRLEEYIYSERSKLQEGDQFLAKLESTLDWLFSDEGEEASMQEYITKMAELKRVPETSEPAAPPQETSPPETTPPETGPQETSAPETAQPEACPLQSNGP